MITPVFIRLIAPESKECYGDVCHVYDNFNLVHTCRSRTSPNPYRPDARRMPWQNVYGQICLGKQDYKCVDSAHFGGHCLLVDRGGKVPTTNLDVNHDAYYATEIFVHKGSSPNWSGSAGCITIHPDDFADFIKFFDLGSMGNIILTDEINFILTREALYEPF